MSDQPTKNFKIAYSDETGVSTDQIDFVKQSDVGVGIEAGQYIYTMPKAFRFGPKVKTNNKVGILVMVAGLILFVGLVYVGYLMLSKKPIFSFRPVASDNNPTPISVDNQAPTTTTTTEPITEVAIDLSDPEQAYLQLRLKLDQAATLEEYLNSFIAGASQNKAYQLAEQTIGLDALSDSQKSSTLSISKSMLVPLSSADQITKDISGDRAVLTITKADTGRIAIVTMLLENDQWKFDDEHWQDAVNLSVSTTTDNLIIPSSSSSTIDLVEEFSLDADTDQDGLTDKEEIILGTKIDQADSDNDGYDDLTELRAGYNPAGSGKITNNSGLKVVKQGRWSTIVPAAWTSQLGRDESAIFRTDDGHFIQAVILTKKNGQDLADWYQEIFTGQTADVVNVGRNQLAISLDGLTYYIGRPDLNYLVSLTYNPETTKLLSYSNIFRLAADNMTLSD
ncbi:MAG TPA: hypothetical protein PLX67_00765 [bacterium]|jgi:hypothetical protein|nr:hypothetical protein [bacterium]HNZ51197.1 hypothetical protein [bacterium]HOF79533.1 hypothetical protein [bacterium]HOH85092.1 hypothetical protein [bacterium]HOQ91657.1 hypothetical protein [bacterium]